MTPEVACRVKINICALDPSRTSRELLGNLREEVLKGQLAQTGSANRHETIFYFRRGARVESQTNDRWIERCPLMSFPRDPGKSPLTLIHRFKSNKTFKSEYPSSMRDLFSFPIKSRYSSFASLLCSLNRRRGNRNCAS